MREENYTFEDMAAILPELWREKAKELDVLQRARENKKSPRQSCGVF
jgi:hypothetical protein